MSAITSWRLALLIKHIYAQLLGGTVGGHMLFCYRPLTIKGPKAYIMMASYGLELLIRNGACACPLPQPPTPTPHPPPRPPNPRTPRACMHHCINTVRLSEPGQAALCKQQDVAQPTTAWA